MDYTIERRDDAVIVSVNGRIDEASWQAFGDSLSQAVEQARQGKHSEVIVDFAAVEYMSSRGLRVLTIAKREGDEAGVELILASPNDVMREILAISRYDKLFKIVPTASALQ